MTEPSVDVLSNDQWEVLREFLELETGMDLSGSRFSRLRDAVLRVGRRQRLLDRLGLLIEDPEHRARFVEDITAELTVGESFFLRNEHHFRVLREKIVPSILEANQNRREIRIWSAGCAAGEEPYSLAILLDSIVDLDQWNVSILGTDLNPEFLERGRRGVYRSWSFRQTMIQHDSQYFAPVPEGYRVLDRIAQRVRFGYLNLVKDNYPSPLNGTVRLDLILFRNVAIYLRPEVTVAILQRFYHALRPGGWLLLGETEVSQSPKIGFEVHRFPHATIHRKPLDAADTEETPLPLPLPAMPVLAEVMDWSHAGPPEVPEIPDWVPLPYHLESVPEAVAETPSELVIPPTKLPDPKEIQSRVLRTADRQKRAVLRLQWAKSLLESADVGRAREEIGRALVDDPLLIEGYILQAGLAEDSGDLDAAADLYRKVLYLDRDCAIAHFHLALLQQQQGDTTLALRSLRNTVRLASKMEPHAQVEYGDGVCYGRLLEMARILDGNMNG